MRRLALIGALTMNWLTTGFGGEIDFVEDFALATDRAAVLKQLVPGTEEYSYYHALHYIQTEQFEKLDPLIATWVQRHGQTQRVWEVRTRQALATYDKNPQRTLDFLRNRLGLTFAHQREELNAEPRLPTSLDQQFIAREAFLQRANAVMPETTDQFEDSALDWLVALDLSPNQRRSLLSRLTRPDYDKLPKHVIEDLKTDHSGGFGSLGIHQQLLITQLEDLVKARPDLLNQQNFVVAYLTKLQPTADEDWRHDPKSLEAYLDRLTKFANRLSPAHNSLKSHVLYHRLVLDRMRGEFNKDRFVEYLKLPRHVGYLSKTMLESDAFKRFASDLNANYGGATLLSAIGNDESLVRSYLAHFLLEAPNTKEFEPYVNDIYLRHLFAEIKIVNGLGDVEQWAALLPPAQFQQLKERVDLDFAFTNKTQFLSDEPVKLDLFVKNAGTLIVKVFEINTQNFYREQLREIDTDVNLDGLVANVEQTHTLRDAPLRRVARKFEFAQLDKPGIYVIDFIGNGRSSRALIRKGRLRHLVRTSPIGHIFTILNDQNEQVKDATLWLSGHEYTADKNGLIAVPFNAASGRQPIVISRGGLASLDYFQHEAEEFALTAGFYVDRESLLVRKTAKVVIRTGLSINGTPASLKRLEEVKLTIVSTDLDGIASSQEVPDFTLFEDRESVHEFQVPQRLASLSFTLTAKAKKLSAGGQKIDLAAGDTVQLNGIDRTEKIECLHLAKYNDTYVLELLGKTGESRISRPVQLTLKHRDFRQPFQITLKTDAAGRINLGRLTDIASISAVDPENTQQSWNPQNDSHTYLQTVQGKVGESITIPYLRREGVPTAAAPADNAATRKELSLLEVRKNVFVSDRFSHLSIKDGFVVISKLPPGDFDLLLKSSGTRIRIRVTEGPLLGGFVLGSHRQLEVPALAPLQIESIAPAAANVSVKLRNTTKFSRVHVIATRYVPEFDGFSKLSSVRAAELYLFQQSPAESVYLTGRNIGDEYRYIIDRKYAPKFPGNMLDRPSLLLNPWAVRTTETGEQAAAAGGEFGKAGAKPESAASRMGRSMPPQSPSPDGHFANLDFLAQTSAVLLNLIPNEDGVIEIPREAIGPHQHIHVFAVDPLSTTYRSFALPESKMEFLDLRLISGLDPKKHFTQQKQISLVPAGQAFTLTDITTSKFEAYDSLARVYNLYSTLNPDPKLIEFAFLLNWPKLKLEEKHSLYSKHASHELSFFLSRKDPEFFQTMIKPYLANKKDKTFLDQFLLEDDLTDFLKPWSYEQLNIVERILVARRLKEERPFASRHVADLFAMLPPNTDNFIRLFDTAAKRSSLETGDQFGFKAAAEQQRDLSLLAADHPQGLEVAAAPMSAPAPAAGGAGLRSGDDRLRDRVAGVKDAEAKQQEASKNLESRRGVKLKKRAFDEISESDKKKVLLGESLDDSAKFFEDGVSNENMMRQLYRKLDKTMEWAENNYHHLLIAEQGGELVTVNAFWNDFAKHDPATPFLSRNLAEASRNFPEMLMALAVLDLPFESPKHETKFDGPRMTLTSGGPLVVFHEEVKPSADADGTAKVLVSQNFFRHGDRTRIENGEQVDQFIKDEFLAQVVYGCQIVITNPTSARQKLNVLLQIPTGAIPVLNSQPTKTVHIGLEPYHTQTVEYHFYFPSAGQYSHFPVHVAKNETLIATTPPFLFHVVDKPTKIDTGSWDYVSQQASTDEVLEFLDKHNVAALNLDRIAWRMQDVKVFVAVVTKLAQRHVYNHTLWSYAIRHSLPAPANEFLKHTDQIINDCGGWLKSELLTIEPVARRTFEHLEYKPLVNARAHALGQRRQIVNDRFFEQYHRTMKQLSYERSLDDADLLTVTYYLLLQDRIDEAAATFARVNSDKVSTKMQYDYCAAYLNFFKDDHRQARAIAAKYTAHPVDRWRKTFDAITAQLDEAEGHDVKPVNPDDRNQEQSQLAATEPNFDFTVEARQIKLDYQNLNSVRVNFYEIDVELLFSRNPFVQQFRGQFSSIKPNHSIDVALDDVVKADETGKKKAATKTIPLPAALQNKNVLVEVVGSGLTKTQPYYAHSLTVQVIENYGQVKISHQTTGQPVPKAYVKVYAKMADGQVKFYKDGYTDLRGRFDFASLNTNDLDVAARFSILMLSDDYGALVREASPPKR